MKVKLYTVLVLLFVCAKSFGGITIKILSPSANATITGSLSIGALVTTTNDVSSVTAKVQDVETGLTYTGSKFEGSISLAGMPQTLLTVKVLVVDVLGNKDSASVNFYYVKPPSLTVTWAQGGGKHLITSPYLHVNAAARADSGSCMLTLIDVKTNKVIFTVADSVDIDIDVSGIAVPGYWANTNISRPNHLKLTATGKRNVTTINEFDYTFEPSPYVTEYPDSIYPFSVKHFVTHHIDEELGFDSYIDSLNIITKDTSFNLSASENVPSEQYRTPGKYKFVINNNYILFFDQVQRNKLNIFNLATSSLRAYNAIYSGATDDNMDIDSSGNAITRYRAPTGKDTLGIFLRDTTYGRKPLGNHFAISGNKFLYIEQQYFFPYKGLVHVSTGLKDTVIADDFFYTLLPMNKNNIDKYSQSKIAGNYIAYYRKGTFGQRTIWLFDSSFNKTRISVSSSNAYLLDLDTAGNTIFGIATGAGDALQKHENGAFEYISNFTTYFADKFGNTIEVAHNGEYFTYNGIKYLKTIDGNYKINLNPEPDSLAPIHREVKKDSAISFAKTDFDNAYTGPGHVFKVKITGLPKHGTLFINKVPITLDSVVAHASLGGLSYKPNPGYSGKDTIHFTVWNGAEFVANDTIIQLSVVATLPVKLLTFTGTPLGKANQLRWQTAQEVNSSYFGVEKSTDGIHFTTMGNVAAKGNSNITQSYEYLDANPQTGLNYYRLKIVDKDASYSYSQTISIRNTGSYVTMAYPNPAKSFVNLNFTAARAGRYSFTVYSASGKAVSTNRYAVNTGSQNITLPLSGIASGTYVIKVLDGEGNMVTEQKVMKQ